MTLQPYQQRLLSFLARAAGPDDKVVFYRGHFVWRSELLKEHTRKAGPRQPLLGVRADTIIIDEIP